MSLHQRLAVADNRHRGAQETGKRRKALDGLAQGIHQLLIEELGSELHRLDLSRSQVEELVKERLHTLVSVQDFPLSDSEKRELVESIADDVLGYGPIEGLLADETVNEIMVNSPDVIYAERGGKLFLTEARFSGEEHLRRVIDKIVGQVGRRVDESVPMVDARLMDGSRVNAVVPPLAVDGAKLTIRKFAKDPYKVDDLVGFGTFTNQLVAFLKGCVEGRLNMMVCGGTGSGKTTTLNVISEFVPDDERIVTIEDAVELQLRKSHTVRLECRPANIEGKGEVTIRDLVRNALRMRPDRIIVGEVRGGEALDMLQAMNTGHDGSLSTIHANSPRDALSRLETMVLMAGVDLPVRAIREQISSAVDVIVHQARLRDGSRRITHVTEICGMEGEIITMQDIFRFDFAKSARDGSASMGALKSTGLRPLCCAKLQERGITFDADVFDTGYLRQGQ